ncbi:hypothetical protein KBZ21_23685 [Streptomyces sp. A73]|uniref:hypothetical protein n=1 Tax=Streptomyces smyrnaeus TaxID=1387713 RepID=UPI001B7294DF|nr:hypothetical protein [Streptomyces sp. A73]
MTDHLTLLGLVVDRLTLHGYDTSTPPPGAWVDAAVDERAETLTHLAWQARRAEDTYPATHAASRLAVWLWREATWEIPGAPEFRVSPSWLCRITPAVQLEAAVRLLAAARTGELPPAPQRCGVCETGREELWLITFPGESGPGWDEWRCSLCAQLPLDPDDVPESVESVYRRRLLERP